MTVERPLYMQNLEYPAKLDRNFWLAMFTEGIVDRPGDNMLVTERLAGVNLSVDVDTGYALVQGDSITSQGSYFVHISLNENIVVPAADPTFARIDLLVLEVRDDQVDSNGSNDARLRLVAGTPASNPTAPALPVSSIALAEVRVPAGASTIVATNITDRRRLVRPAKYLDGPVPSGDTSGAADTRAINHYLKLLDVGGTLHLTNETCIVRLEQLPGYVGVGVAVQVPSDVTLEAEGRGGIKLADSQPAWDFPSIVRNLHPEGGDENITVRKMFVDGNAANQTDIHNGIDFHQVRGVDHDGVIVKNVRGTSNGPPGETFHMNVTGCFDVNYRACRVFSDDGGDTATGFSANVSTIVNYSGCIAHDMEHGHGFTHWHCAQVTHDGCFAYLNGAHGFNSEHSRDVIHNASIAGGSANDEIASIGAAINASLGNGGSGFTFLGTARYELNGCRGILNGTSGMAAIKDADDNVASGKVNGGFYTANGTVGLYFGTVDDARACDVSTGTHVTGNDSGDIDLGSGTGGPGIAFFEFLVPGQSFLPGGTIPADGDVVDNIYPCDIEWHLVGGAGLNFLTLGGTNIVGNPRLFTVKRGGQFTLHYGDGNGPTAMIAYRT